MENTGKILSKVGKGQIISKKPLIVSIRQKNELKGKLNIGVKKITEYIHFEPYVEQTTLFFRTQASVEESELIIRG